MQPYLTTAVQHDFDENFLQQDPAFFHGPEEDILMRNCHSNWGYDIGLNENTKESSGATTGSLLSVGSPSVVTENGSRSLVIVYHKRTYSEASDGTSGATSENRPYSTLDETELMPAAECAIDNEGIEDATMLAPHDAQYTLSSLSSRGMRTSSLVDSCCLLLLEPRSVPDPYQTLLASSDNGSEYNISQHYVLQYSSQNGGFPMPSEIPRIHNGFEPPWTAVHPQMSRFPPGFVAFAPIAGPAVDQDLGDTQSLTSTSSSIGTGLKRKSQLTRSLSKGKGKSTSLTWEHTTVASGGLTRVIENDNAHSKHRSGVRNGRLPLETAEKARRIRKIKACWNCWIQKVPVGDPFVSRSAQGISTNFEAVFGRRDM
jgi:hypothetical protein